MDIVYFKKEVPQTPVHMANGVQLKFDSVDGQVGYTLSVDPGVIFQLDRLIAKGIGGISRSTKEEYEEFLDKKKDSPSLSRRQPWREEIRPAGQYAPDLANDAVAGSPKGRGGEVQAVTVQTRAVSDSKEVKAPLQPVEPFKPKTSRKKK